MNNHVWVSKAMTDPDLIGRVNSGILVRDQHKAFLAENLNNAGQPVPEEYCPKRIWIREGPDVEFPRLLGPISNLFHAAGCHWIASAKAAEIIGRFDLGGGALYPVSEGVYEFDNATPFPGDYFTWIFGNVKQAFLPDETPTKNYLGPYPPAWWHMPWEMVDGDIAVSRVVLEGPDVWIDPLLFRSIFLSSALGDALAAAGLRQDFELFRCKVI